MDFRQILQLLIRREHLSREQSILAFEHLMSGQANESQIAGFLSALSTKGPTSDEILGAATVMRQRAISIACPSGEITLDTCGTGGDVKGTFNISTAAALVAAAAGVRVVKHGNRSASSKTGSADVLESLGVKLDLPPEKLSACLAKVNLCFAYARNHHPAMKHVAAARQALGVPTIFNYLGPLTNPAGAKHQLLGVFAAHLTETLAKVLRDLGTTRAWVVHAEDGLDELSTLCPTRITELRNGEIRTYTFNPRDLNIREPRLHELQVESADQSAGVIQRIFEGEKFPPRDITLLNAAAALVIGEKAPDLRAGYDFAAKAVDSGAALGKLRDLIACTNA